MITPIDVILSFSILNSYEYEAIMFNELLMLSRINKGLCCKYTNYLKLQSAVNNNKVLPCPCFGKKLWDVAGEMNHT
jgi:hypothetical protein